MASVRTVVPPLGTISLLRSEAARLRDGSAVAPRTLPAPRPLPSPRAAGAPRTARLVAGVAEVASPGLDPSAVGLLLADAATVALASVTSGQRALVTAETDVAEGAALPGVQALRIAARVLAEQVARAPGSAVESTRHTLHRPLDRETADGHGDASAGPAAALVRSPSAAPPAALVGPSAAGPTTAVVGPSDPARRGLAAQDGAGPTAWWGGFAGVVRAAWEGLSGRPDEVRAAQRAWDEVATGLEERARTLGAPADGPAPDVRAALVDVLLAHAALCREVGALCVRVADEVETTRGRVAGWLGATATARAATGPDASPDPAPSAGPGPAASPAVPPADATPALSPAVPSAGPRRAMSPAVPPAGPGPVPSSSVPPSAPDPDAIAALLPPPVALALADRLEALADLLEELVVSGTAELGRLDAAGLALSRAGALLRGSDDPGPPGATAPGSPTATVAGPEPIALDHAVALVQQHWSASASGGTAPPLPAGWRRVQPQEVGLDPTLLTDERSGFSAALFTGAAWVLSFAGTDFSGDLVADFLVEDLTGGLVLSPQVADVLALVDAVHGTALRDRLVWSGHSLGGRLAAVAAMASGDTAVTFNAAGVSTATTGYVAARRGTTPEQLLDRCREQGTVRAYRTEGDVVTVLQEHLPTAPLLPDAPGRPLPLGRSVDGLVEGHLMPHVVVEWERAHGHLLDR